jgi:transcriptional regulator with XRE-family HTH domain
MSEIDLDILTSRIKKKMELLDVNQAKLAKMAGITPGALSQILSQDRTPSTGVLVKLAKALGESVDYLVGKADETSIDALLQNSETQLLFREFSGLSSNDKEQIVEMMEFLKKRKK